MNWYKQAQFNQGKVKYLPQGSVAILGKNTKPEEGAWRISFLEYGRPAWHDDYPTYSNALEVFEKMEGKESRPDLTPEESYELV
jgi:hypothetical protein